MYAKAKVCMEWVKFMTRKYDIGMFFGIYNNIMSDCFT